MKQRKYWGCNYSPPFGFSSLIRNIFLVKSTNKPSIPPNISRITSWEIWSSRVLFTHPKAGTVPQNIAQVARYANTCIRLLYVPWIAIGYGLTTLISVHSFGPIAICTHPGVSSKDSRILKAVFSTIQNLASHTRTNSSFMVTSGE